MGTGTLPQELSFVSEVRRSVSEPLNVRTEIRYSNEPQRNVVVDFVLASARGSHRAEMNVTHPATQLDMRQVVTFFQTSTVAQVNSFIQGNFFFELSRKKSQFFVKILVSKVNILLLRSTILRLAKIWLLSSKYVKILGF